MDNNLILKRFFSKKVFEDLFSGKENDVFNHVVKRYIADPDNMSYGEIISEIYCYLDKNYRTEYYYKNTLLNKLLLKRHNYKKTIVLTELPIAESKADFVMINGRGVVYEIKTELDNFDRLQAQVADYYKAFQYVYIVTYESALEKLLKMIDQPVGIILVTRRGAIKTYREAARIDDFLSHESIFKILRKYEFENIIVSKGFELPQVSQFLYYEECYKIIEKIDILDFYEMALSELKKRMKIEIVERAIKMPKELRFLSYFDEKICKNINEVNVMLQNNGG